jgi:hypothetical protein
MAARVCEANGYELVIEASDRSESVYLHVRRHAVWHGFRVACHEPAYACSADYFQMIVPDCAPDCVVVDGGVDLLRQSAIDYLAWAIVNVDCVVADPSEVAAAIAAACVEARERAAELRQPGRVAPQATNVANSILGRRGRPWRKRRASRPVGREAIARGVRHQLNQRAKWTFDCERRDDSGKERFKNNWGI